MKALLELLTAAAERFLDPGIWLMIVLGMLVGIPMGAAPGLSGTMGLAIFIPVTYWMPADKALLFLAGLYCAAMYGGSIGAILLNCPGTPSSTATTFDGYELTKKGRAMEALAISTTASAFGGTLSMIALITIAPILAMWAVKFGPPEYFMLAVFGLSIIAVVSKGGILKGLATGAFGLLLSTMGWDTVVGIPRFTFGLDGLQDGLPFLPVLIGLFAISECIALAERGGTISRVTDGTTQKLSEYIRQIKRGVLGTFSYPVTLLRSSLLGIGIGALPGAGGDIANFLAYFLAKNSSKNGDKFGTGEPEGVVAPEASNNAVTGGALIPLLTLGIPGNAATAVFAGGLLIHGMRPGPEIFTGHLGVVTYTLMLGLILANIVMLPLGLIFCRFSARITEIKNEILCVIVFPLCLIGSFALRNSVFDVGVAFVFGVLGYWMRKYNYPVVCIVLALVLGPIAERSLRQSLLMSQGSWLIFLSRPISLTLFILTILGILYPIVVPMIKQRLAKRRAVETV